MFVCFRSIHDFFKFSDNLRKPSEVFGTEVFGKFEKRFKTVF